MKINIHNNFDHHGHDSRAAGEKNTAFTFQVKLNAIYPIGLSTNCVIVVFYEFITYSGLLYLIQAGFQQHCSTATALMKLTEDIRTESDKRHSIVSLLFDLSICLSRPLLY